MSPYIEPVAAQIHSRRQHLTPARSQAEADLAAASMLGGVTSRYHDVQTGETAAGCGADNYSFEASTGMKFHGAFICQQMAR